MMVRLPAVAGQFYSASVETLRADIRGFMAQPDPRQTAVAAIAPHAGLLYSGYVAGAVYSRLMPYSTVILIGPNHTGLGPPISVYPEGIWMVPGGEVAIDSFLTNALLASFPRAQADAAAHRFEHCLEMQLPFLLHGYNDDPDQQGMDHVPKMVAIVLGTTELELCRAFGETLAQLIVERAETSHSRPLLIASTDMNHYESDDITRKKDAVAIEAIERLEPNQLHAAAHLHDISMCGLGPTITVLAAARKLQATHASLIRYATSGDVSGDHDRVVGYAGFIIR